MPYDGDEPKSEVSDEPENGDGLNPEPTSKGSATATSRRCRMTAWTESCPTATRRCRDLWIGGSGFPGPRSSGGLF